LDAIIAPTSTPAWKTDHVNGDHYILSSSTPAAIAGYPNITVPMGEIQGLPVGMSFFGTAWSEPQLIEIAFAFEQATFKRWPPQFLKP
jgi:amidase